MPDSYIHLGDFEKFVRNRFKHITGGKGLLVPRLFVEAALNDIFEEAQDDYKKDTIKLEKRSTENNGSC